MYLDVFLRIPENTCILRVLRCIALYLVLYSVVCIGRVFNTYVLDVFCMYVVLVLLLYWIGVFVIHVLTCVFYCTAYVFYMYCVYKIYIHFFLNK